MKTISYYIYMAVFLMAAVFTGCTEEDGKQPLSLFTGELSIHDFAPSSGKGGTQLLINGEQFPLDLKGISVSINGIDLPVLKVNEEQILVEIPDNETIGTAPISVKVNGETVQSKETFSFLKAKVTASSPSSGKVGTQVQVMIENMPVKINNLTATFNGLDAECESDGKSVTVIIPQTEPGTYPIIIKLNDRVLTIEGFEYKELMYERTILTLAGHSDMQWGFVNGPGAEARFKFTGWVPCRGGICVDDAGNVFVTDTWNCAVRKITPDGTVSTFAKTVSNGPDDTANEDWGANWRNGTGKNGTKDVWLWAYAMDMDKDGNLFVVNDKSAHMVRYDVNGFGHYFGWQASLSCAVDKTRGRFYVMNNSGNIYLKDDLNDYGESPLVTIADNEKYKIISNGAIGGMTVDEKTGDLYVTNVASHTIVKYPFDNWKNATVIAGNGSAGNKDGLAAEASFDQPWGLAFTPKGNLLVAGAGSATPSADDGYHDSSIRHIDLATGMVTTFAGGGKGNENGSVTLESYAGVNSSVTALPASFVAPTAICVDKEGTVYVLDRGNNCVKKIVTIEK